MKIPTFLANLPLVNRISGTGLVPGAPSTSEVVYQSSGTPGSYYRGRGGEYRRFTPAMDIMRARDLYELESYGAEIINNVVDFAVGEGPVFHWESETIGRMWEAWAWNRSNVWDRPAQLARTGVLRLIRDGQMLDAKRLAVDGPYIEQLNPAFLQSSRGPDGYGGVTVDGTGRPLRYLYRPHLQSILNPMPRTYRADEVIHVFRTDWEEQLVGETWLRRSLVPLWELDDLDRWVVESAKRRARTPNLYKIPTEWAYTYVRPVDESGNPVDPDESPSDMVEAGANLLRRTMLRRPTAEGVIPKEVEVEKQVYGEAKADAERLILLQRVSRGLGLSVPALLGDHGKAAYLSSRFAVVQDEKFYINVQTFARRYLDAVIDWWLQVTLNAHFDLRNESREYRIDMPLFPMANLLQDVNALEKLHKMRAVSTPAVARRYGYDPDRMLEEQMEWDAKTGPDETPDDGEEESTNGGPSRD